MKAKAVKFVLILTILFSYSACEVLDKIDDNVSECEEKANQISPAEDVSFNVRCRVFWKNGDPIEDLTVKYQIHKEYCNGKTSGFREDTRLTQATGVWETLYISTYTYKNIKDKVLIKFIIAPGAYDYEYDFIYRWEDVDKFPYYHVFSLPINADGS